MSSPFQTKEQLIRADRWPTAAVETKEAGNVRVAGLDQREAALVAQVRVRIGKGELPMGAHIVEAIRLGVIDKEGKRVFKTAADVEAVAISVTTALALVEKIDEITEYPEAKKDGAAEGNSEASPSDASPSVSP